MDSGSDESNSDDGYASDGDPYSDSRPTSDSKSSSGSFSSGSDLERSEIGFRRATATGCQKRIPDVAIREGFGCVSFHSKALYPGCHL